MLDSLKWVVSIGGRQALIARSEANLAAAARWVEKSSWVRFLAEVPETRSCTSMCFKIVDPWFTAKTLEERTPIAKRVSSLLEEEQVAFDIGSYAEAPPGLRIWGGATIERTSLEQLFPWLDWAYAEVKKS